MHYGVCCTNGRQAHTIITPNWLESAWKKFENESLNPPFSMNLKLNENYKFMT